jgi:hypothetical protein
MEQQPSSSEPLSPASALLNASKLLLREDPPSRDTVQEVTKILAKVILDLNSSLPREPMRTVVDNSGPASDAIDETISEHSDNAKINGNRSLAPDSANPAPQVSPFQLCLPALRAEPTSINAISKTALVIEKNESLLKILTTCLKHEGYAVRTTNDSCDGFRLYIDCAPFDIVLIGGLPQKQAEDIAFAVLKENPLQQMIMTAFEFRHEEEVQRPKELTHIPLAIDVKSLRKLLEKIQFWATREEIDHAIDTLLPAQWLKLQKTADCRVFGVGRFAGGQKGKDLLGEALLSTLVGSQGNGTGRRWNKRVDFVKHLTEAMRGISSHWKDRVQEQEFLECETVISDAEGQELSPLDNLVPGDTPHERLRVAVTEGFQPAEERRLIAKEELERIFGTFKNDRVASSVLEAWSEGMKKNEILQKYELRPDQYDAAARRIRVKLLVRRNGGRGDEQNGR